MYLMLLKKRIWSLIDPVFWVFHKKQRIVILDSVPCLQNFHIPALFLSRSILKKISTYDGVSK